MEVRGSFQVMAGTALSFESCRTRCRRLGFDQTQGIFFAVFWSVLRVLSTDDLYQRLVLRILSTDDLYRFVVNPKAKGIMAVQADISIEESAHFYSPELEEDYTLYLSSSCKYCSRW